jgi:microcystin-dependent protein
MAADISAVFRSLSSTEGSNSPSGTTSVSTNLDDNLRMLGALMGAWRDACGWGTLRLTSVAGTNTITASVAAQGSVTMAPSAYSTGQRFTFTPANTNTGAATLNVDSIGAKNIYLNGVALVGYELRTNCPVTVEYDGTQFKVIAGAHGGDGVPVGKVVPFAGATAPAGYLFCYGQAVNRADYADLFGVVSTTYGTGDGSTTFNLPDLRGRVVAGQDDMGGSSANRLTNQTGGLNGDTLGAAGGSETHTLTAAQLPLASVANQAQSGSGVNPITSQSPEAFNIVQPTFVLNYVIKT